MYIYIHYIYIYIYTYRMKANVQNVQSFDVDASLAMTCLCEMMSEFRSEAIMAQGDISSLVSSP